MSFKPLVVAALFFSAPATFAANGDGDKGEKIFRKCAACHQVGQGAKNRVGPILNGIFGAKAGAVDGFPYSDALKRAASEGLIWDLEHLDAFIENPKSLITKTRMNFRGLKDTQDRQDVLAYMRRFSDDPADIPEAAPSVEVELPAAVLALVGDPEYGEYLGSECLTCHQTSGSDQGIPSITQWPTNDFVIAMHAYKKKLRPHPVMQMMAARLSDEEIAALAAYFKGLE